MKKILADVTISRKLREIFGCSRRMVNYALSGASSSDLALRIRHMALKLGGQEKGEEEVVDLNKKS